MSVPCGARPTLSQNLTAKATALPQKAAKQIKQPQKISAVWYILCYSCSLVLGHSFLLGNATCVPQIAFADVHARGATLSWIFHRVRRVGIFPLGIKTLVRRGNRNHILMRYPLLFQPLMQNTHQGRNPKPEDFFFWQWSQGSWQRLFAQVFTEFNAFRTGLGHSRLPQRRFYAKNPGRCTNTVLQSVHRINFILDHGLHYEWIKCWILFGFYAGDRTANL